MPESNKPATVTANQSDIADTNTIAKLIGVSPQTIGNYRAQGLVPFIKIGKSVRFHVPSVMESLVRRQRGGIVA
jgi:hypothetical protein